MMRAVRKDAGYTLLEILIAIVIIGIGFLALIAVQLGALRGFVSARDNLQATEMARRVANIIQAQGQQWMTGTWSGNTAYDGLGPFDETDPIGAAITGSGAWVPLYDDPADFATGRPALDTNYIGGKFCAFVRGGPMTGAIDGSVLQFQIAVVYPNATAKLTDCLTDITLTDLDVVGSATTVPALEAKGLRASYYGTVVVRRSFLADAFAVVSP